MIDLAFPIIIWQLTLMAPNFLSIHVSYTFEPHLLKEATNNPWTQRFKKNTVFKNIILRHELISLNWTTLPI